MNKLSKFDNLFMTYSCGQMFAGDFEILLEFSKDKETIVELGTARGLGAMILSSNGGTVYTIDKGTCIDKGPYRLEHLDERGQEDWQKQKSDYLSNWNNIICIKDDSANAASRFENESVDLLFIDAGHTLADVTRDYNAWLPKVKKGEIILFHDAMYQNVHEDVWFFCHELEKYSKEVEVINYEPEYKTVIKVFRKN